MFKTRKVCLMLISMAASICVVSGHPIAAHSQPIPTKTRNSELGASDTLSPTRTQRRDLEDAGDVMQTVSSVIDKIQPVADALGPEGEAVGEALEVISTFLDILGQLFEAIGEEQRQEAATRGAFTQNVTDATLKAHPGWNVVTVHPKHTVNFQGSQGPDWEHNTTSIELPLSGNVGFDVYAARAGIFELNGDGGYMNWAWAAGSNVQAVGYQNHRLIFRMEISSGAPPKNEPASGNCGVHITQYQKNEKEVNPVNHYTLNVILKDANGMVVGFNGNGDASTTVSVTSQLPYVFEITAGNLDNDPLSFAYGGDKWDSSTKGRCSVGKYDSGSRQMDFVCFVA
ncbi:hypothetical protein D9757_004425 [Collybiopsis confluens]|uniref:Uncharacterized protein n=1 Tax=Collybiopsis confluens TaxID=2823264 RepID=A0A8H5HWT8_9AGAR|nr:hypothetical protein D9757_004425 [Collybiopsis confluens]